MWLAVVAGVLVVLAGGCGVLVVLGSGLDQALTHQLLDAPVTNTASPCSVGEGGGKYGPYRYELVDGHYVITATAPDDNWAVSAGAFARRAFTVYVDAVVVARESGSTAGVACLAQGGRGYLLDIGPTGVRLLRIPGAGQEVSVLDSSLTVPDPAAPHRLELSCHQSLNPSDQTISGSVDGRALVRATDGEPPSDGYTYAGLTLLPSGAGASVAFDDVVATVPE